MRHFYCFIILAHAGIEAVDPERVFEDLDELATVQFWQDRAHVKCLVKALQADRTSLSPRIV